MNFVNLNIWCLATKTLINFSCRNTRIELVDVFQSFQNLSELKLSFLKADANLETLFKLTKLF